MATVVFVHAHPDDEALLTGGSMSLLAARGHRVVLVTATDGAAGLAAADFGVAASLAEVRSRELAQSCQELGVAQFYALGYADSGLDGRAEVADTPRFVDVPIPDVAARIAEVLDAEQADLVVTYDAAGGYGHPDHIRVHDVTHAAVSLRATPLVESTIPREPILRGVSALYAMRWLVPALKGLDMQLWQRAFTPRSLIWYRLNVRSVIDRKRAALAAHASQASADDGPRTISALLRLPKPVFTRLLGTEWFGAPTRSEWTSDERVAVARILGQPLSHR